MALPFDIEYLDGTYTIEDTYMADGEESYKSGVEVDGEFQYLIYDNVTLEKINVTGANQETVGDVSAGYIDQYGNIQFHNLIVTGESEADGTIVNRAYVPLTNYAPTNTFSGNFSINVPIFETDIEWTAYINAQTEEARLRALKEALNYSSGEVSPSGLTFEISVQWTTSTWVNDNQPAVTGQPNFQGLRGKITDGKIALYEIEGIDGGALKYGIKSTASFFGLQYSNDGYTWTDTNTIPYQFIYRRRKNELGTFSYALSFSNGTVPIRKDENDAEDYITGDSPIEDSENWPIISPKYPNPSTPGVPEPVTEFGEVGARSVFSQQYILSTAAVYEIANTFYDTTTAGLWDDIKKGLEMYGDSPIECIENLSYYPYGLTNVFPTQSQNYIFFGGYQLSMQNSVARIINPDGHIDLGSVNFHRINNNWLDFEPYCKLFVEIPYCGEYQLDLSEYYDKELSVKYFVDTRTGSCCCCLLANGHLVDKFNGQMGVQMPIKLTDFSAYANSQIQTLLGMGGQSMQSMGNVGSTASQALASGSGAALAGAGALAVGVGGVMGAKTVYGLAQNNINRYNKTKGGSTSMLNMYMPQKVTFTFERNIPDIPSNFYQLYGYPSNAGGSIGSFSGYLECEQVKLSMPGATESEKDKARSLLMNGVFI